MITKTRDVLLRHFNRGLPSTMFVRVSTYNEFVLFAELNDAGHFVHFASRASSLVQAPRYAESHDLITNATSHLLAI